MRLFLCDDNAHYRQLARRMLEKAGHEIVGEAGDGGECIESAPLTDPEVLLLDLNMPGVSGWDALPRLREALPRTKLVILTTGQGQDEPDRTLRTTADGYIVKPPRVSALHGELVAALSS